MRFALRFGALLCTLSFLVSPCSCIVRCSSVDDFLRSGGAVELIDGEFEDCGFEGPLMGDYGDVPPTSKMTFDFNVPDVFSTNMALNLLISPRGVPDDVREVTITGYHWAGNLPAVEHAFDKMHNLEKVHWEIHQPLTDNTLRALERNNPDCKLYYSFRGRRKVNFSLVNSTLLYSLKADIPDDYGDNYAPMDFVFAALQNAPNLKELDIFLHEDGCDAKAESPSAFPFSRNDNVHFVSLEVLKLNGYDLDERSDGGMAWSWRGKTEEYIARWTREYLESEDEDAIPPPRPERPEDDGRTNLEAWLDAMDWTSLHTLHLTSPSRATLNKLRKPALPALKYLSINAALGWAATQDEILSFVTNGIANLLQSITLQNMGAESGDELLQTLTSQNLTRELRHFSYGAGGRNIFYLNETKLSALLAESPNLEHLDINIPRDSIMTIESGGIFRSILSTPPLNHLALRFPSPDENFLAPGSGWLDWGQILDKATGLYHELDPLINLETVRRLFDDMREKKQGVELETLEIYVGDWVNRYEVPNEPIRVAYYECTVLNGCQGEQTRMK